MRNSRKGRFRVWDRSQDSFNGEDLVYNFDNLDSIIGGPDGTSGGSGAEFGGSPSTWLGSGDAVSSLAASRKYPGTTNAGYEIEAGRRTLYSIVSGLNYNDVPLGTVITWWRPNAEIAIPDGWVPCDGRQINPDQHSYPIVGSITVPDLRNKFALGADHGRQAINAVNGYAHRSDAAPGAEDDNNWTGSAKAEGQAGAPGIGYDTGLEPLNAKTGTNRPRIIDHAHDAGNDPTINLKIKSHRHEYTHTHTIAPHKHVVPSHSHDMGHVHLMPNHVHEFSGGSTLFSGQGRTSTQEPPVESKVEVREGLTANYSYPAGKDHIHKIDLTMAGTTGGRLYGQNYPYLGLFALGGWNSPIWGFTSWPPDMVSGLGYQFQAITSYPTFRRHYDNTLNAHEVRYNTGEYAPVYGSVELATGAGFDGVQRSGVIETRTPTNKYTGEVYVSSSSDALIEGKTAQHAKSVKIRPQYVGLLYLIKVRVATNLV